MSTITREFTKEQLQQIIETDHVQCGEASALARIALASLEAKSRKLFTCSGCGAEGLDEPLESKCHCNEDGAHWVESVVYTAPPAPVSVPEHIRRNDADGWLMYKGRRVGGGCAEWYNRALDDCRAAMLQGADVSLTHEGKNHHEDKLGMVNHLGDANEKDNFPVIPDGWVVCSERMPEQFKAILAFNEYGEVWSGAYDRYWNFYCDNLLVEHVTHWMPLPAAPKQELK